ncbi:MAG TPA: Wzz/FepE/Etk N-terminal domain-containing protein [Atopostipes sp.]|nr:Wzz/FepE/Etk N-terminal domain-containing protein [Atopostipes sp.]
MEEEISLVELFGILKKHFRVIVLTTLFTAVIAAIYTFFLVTPKYQSSTEMLVSQSSDNTTSVSTQDINTSVQLINTYSDIIRNEVILEPVIDELGLEQTPGQLRENIRVQTENNSQVFSIQVQDENPYRASEIANATASYFQEEIYNIMNVDNVTIISSATPNLNPVSPNNLLNIVIGLLLGGMIGVGIVFIRELLDNTVKSPEKAEEITGWISLGSVNRFSKEDLMVRTPLPKANRSEKKLEMKSQRTRRRV